TGGLFGLEEDSPIVGVILGIRDTVVNVFNAAKDAVTGFIDGFGGMDSLGATLGPIVSMLAGPLGFLKDTLLAIFEDIDFAAVGKTIGSAVRPIVDTVTGLYGVVLEVAVGLVRQLAPV